MYKILYKPAFIKQYGKLEVDLKEEVVEKIELLKNKSDHPKLKVHKLHGDLKDKFSFSVNYKIRIVFKFVRNEEIHILGIGDHDIYK